VKTENITENKKERVQMYDIAFYQLRIGKKQGGGGEFILVNSIKIYSTGQNH
jgi:hypothetical protein